MIILDPFLLPNGENSPKEKHQSTPIPPMMFRELLTPKLLHLNDWVIFSSSSYILICVFNVGKARVGKKFQRF